MVPIWEQVYKRKKAGGICSNLPDPSQRSKKATHKDFCPNGGGDTLNGNLEPGTGDTLNIYSYSWYICGWLSSKESANNSGNTGLISGSGSTPREGNGNPLQWVLAWKIPWTEEPGRLQSMGS